MRLTTKYSLSLSCIIIILLYDTDKTLASGSPQCKFKCRGQSNTLLKLEEGVSYIYNLEGNTETYLPKARGPFGESVKLNLKCKVEVTALPQCKTVIQLREVHISGPDGKVHGDLPQLQEHPLVVSLNGGKLDSEVCGVHDDSFASLNIKRAVASLLQANTGENGGNSNENDVFGSCPTHFKVVKEGDVFVINKHKDLEKCQFRENLRQSFFSTAHGHAADIQATPLLESQYEVEQRIKNGILESATAKEEYLFRPFSNRDNGAKTRVITKMVLESKSPAPPPAFQNNEPKAIFFDNPHETVTCSIHTLVAALHKVTDPVDGPVPTSGAKEFGTLVKLMRRSSKEDLLSVYGNCKAGAEFPNRQVAKKVFTDALFQAGSADSVAAAVELLKSNEITGDLAKLWYLSFAFVRHTSASALASATMLLSNPKLPYEAYLGIGALAGHYCREHVCEGIPQFDQLLAKFTEVIGTPAKVSRDRENYVISALKGLRNIKHLNEETANKITHIMKDGHVSTRIRVAALETAQSDACRGKIQKGAGDIFFNREEDSELRIKAYLVLVECPNAKFASKLSEFMETEPVNQVGAFVTSHLRNLRSSFNPDKDGVREILYNVKPRRKFPFDIRKFSQNHELSYNLDALNTAAGVESNVIFSQKSYLPRSVNLNLTVEVFGHAFNLFELSGRAENLEKIYERYFGPRGYFKTHKPMEILKEARQVYKELETRIDEKYKNIINRGRRSVSRPDINRFASKVKLYNSKLDYNIDVDLSMKVLGNELSWVNIEDIEAPLTPSAVVDKLATFVENGIGSAKDFRRDLKNHYHFLDSELIYPTSTGFPLRLSAAGSGVVYLKLGGKFDAAAFVKNPKNALVKFEIIPSASVEIDGEMGIDGYAVETGVKLAGNLHTSTGTEVTLKMLDGHGFDLHIGLPIKKSDVVTITTDLFSYVREQGLPSVDSVLEFNVPRKDYHGCFDQLQSLVGLTFCGDLGFPNDKQSIMSSAAMYPLNGHSKLSFRLDKDDETLTTYHMRFFFDIENPRNKRIELKIDTPGTKHPREVSFLAALVTDPEKAIDVQFISPIHKFVARGAIVDNDAEYSLSAFARIDDAQEYKARLGLTHLGGGSYAPVFEVSPASGAIADVKIDGQVFVEKQPNSPRRKFTFRGVRLMADKMTYTVDGVIGTDTNMFETDLKVGYDQHSAGIKTKFLLRNPKNFKISAEISPSQYPDFNVGVNYEHQRSDRHWENALEITHGRDLASTQNKFSLHQRLDYNYENMQNFDIATKNTLSYPVFEIEGKFDGAFTRKSASYDTAVAYGKYRAKSRLNAKHSIKELGDYDVEIMFGAFDKELTLEAKRDIVDPYKSRFTQKLEIKPGKVYDLAAEVTHHFANNEVKLGIIATSTNYPNYALDAGLATSPVVFDGYLKVNDGSKNAVDGFLKFSRTPPMYGNFKLFVEGHVDAYGEYKFQDDRVTGELSAHLVDLKTNVKGTANLVKAGNKFTGLIEGLSEHEGAPKYTLRIETDTDLTPKAISSKNKVSVSDKHLEVNFHGDSQGTESDGSTTGGYEITLPDGKYFTGSVKEALHMLPRNANGELFVELGYSPQRGGPLSKVFLDTFVKNLDLKKYSIDSKLDFGKECPEGNIKFANIFRSVPHDEKLLIDQETNVVGNILKAPFSSKSHALLSRPEVNYDVATAYGDFHFKSRGKILTGLEDKVRHLECMAEINTPLESVRRVQMEQLFHLAQGDENRPHVIQLKQDYAYNDKAFKLNGDAELHLKHGTLKGSLALPGEAGPSNLEINYKREINNDIRKAEVSLTANYDNDKNLALNTVLDYKTDLDLVNGHFTGQTSLQNLRTFDVQFAHKKLSTTARNTDFNILLNDNRIEGFAKIDITPKQPLIDITANTPQGKSRLFYKLNRKSDRQSTSEAQVAWTVNGGGQLDISTNVDIESYDNFHILVKANSEKLNVNKLKLEVGNKAVKSGAAKKINFAAQTADKKGFSGSVTYAVKESDVGFTIEGKGHIEFQNEKHPLTYRAQYKALTKAADNETGTAFSLNADFEKGNLSFEHKITDKQIYYTSKFCKDGQCSHFEIKNQLQILDYTEARHDASITYLNSFEGRNDDFKFFSKTHRKGFSVNHETGLRLQDRAYNMKYYVNDGEGGLVVHTPRREIAAVASYDLPVNLMTGKPKTDLKNIQMHFDGSLYMDRINKPQERGNLFISGDFTASPRLVSTKGEIKLSHPALSKDLVIRGKGAAGLEQRLIDASIEVDIFNRKNQRIAASFIVDHIKTNGGHNVTGNLEFTSKGMNLDVGSSGHLFANEHGLSVGSFVYYHDSKNAKKEAGVFLEANPKRFFALVRIPNRELLKVDSNIQGTPQQQVIDTEINVAELRHYVSRIETTGLHDVRASLSSKEFPNKALEMAASVSPKLVDFRVEKSEGPAKDNLLLIVLTSKQNQEARPNFEINSEKIKHCMQEAKTQAKELAQQVKTLLIDLSKESADEYGSMIKSIKKVQPDFKPLLQHYQAEFDVIRKELAEDPQFKKFSQIFQNVFGGVIEAIEAYVKKLITVYEKLSNEATEFQSKLVESYKEVLHRFTESYEKLLEPVIALGQQICDIGCAMAGYGLDFLKQHEPEIRQLLIGVSGYIQEFVEICSQNLEQVRHEAEDFFRIVMDQVKNLPVLKTVEEQFKKMTDLELPQTLKNFYSEFTFALEDISKTSELREFYENAFAYLVKLPIPSFLIKLPRIGALRELSFVRYLKSLTELPTLTEYYFTYRPFLHLEDNIPPFKAYGIILNSHHFFTFDQKHFAFKGICSYVLAQDFLDGNFSIVANIENAKIKSITVSDQHDTVELFNDMTVSVNGVHGDYPVNHNDFSGWVRYGTFNLRHKSGVFITKYSKQDMFIFRISGFYFGRTRGLLGTISNEHYDDYTLPNGHIAKDATEFANSYKIMDACPASTEFPPAQGHAPECTKLFTSDSDFRSGFNFINHEIYREACDQHVGYVQSDKHTAACDVASAYVLALKQGYMPYAAVPEECVQCNVNGQPLPLGQTMNVQFPQGKADVIIVFEQSAFNHGIFKELVTPLIASLSHDLREKGLGDVEFALIGYGGPNNEWPQHFGNNGKLTYEGKADQIKFKETDEPKETYETWEKKLNFIVKYINIELGHQPIVQAMQEANIYPYRQGAAKIILLVNSQSCPLSPTFPFSLQIPRILAIRKYYSDLGLQFHFITPMEKTLKLTNKPDAELKNVVGFDANKIYTFADAKSNAEGDPTDRPHLIYKSDLCLSFSQYNGGAVFNSNVFAHAKPEQQKKFVHVVSKRIAKGAVEHRYTETCSCKLYHGIFYYPSCKGDYTARSMEMEKRKSAAPLTSVVSVVSISITLYGRKYIL